MTIDEAIKESEAYYNRYDKGMLSKERDALKLGIEALKRLKTLREPYHKGSWSLLLGETDEGIEKTREEIVHTIGVLSRLYEMVEVFEKV